MGSLLGAPIFAALFVYLNIGLDSEPAFVGFANFVVVLMMLGFGARAFAILLRRLFTKHRLTADHLIVERGILARSEKTIPIGRIQDVATSQWVIERPFGIGDVVVETAGERGAVVLDDLSRCRYYSDVILQAVEDKQMGQS